MSRRRWFRNKRLPFNRLIISKREKFVIAVAFLSFGLFFSEHLLGESGVVFSFLLAFLSVFLLFITNYRDIKENFSISLLILPFFYSLSFGLFFSLIPARFLTRIAITSLYAIGLYSLFLSENIFTVSSMRTIALLSSARTVSFIITLVSYFFLSNVIFSLHLPAIPTALLVFVFSFFLTVQSIWMYTLESSFFGSTPWAAAVSFCLSEIALLLWFWPATPTLIALFLTGFFYTIVGLSHVWFEKRLFRNVLWEYIWVAALVSCILFLFTSWRG